MDCQSTNTTPPTIQRLTEQASAEGIGCSTTQRAPLPWYDLASSGLLHEDAVLQTTVAMCAAAAGFILCIMSFLGIWQIRKRATVEAPPRRMLFGVDITDTRFVDRPVCLQAAVFAAEAHKGRYRKSGEPYVHHCVSTAVITEQMMLHLFSDDEWAIRRAEDCIVTALLHDTLDDGDATLSDVEAHAGSTVAALVSSVARLSRNNQLLRRAYRRMIAAGEKMRAEAEIEAMKSMILQMTEEPLVIIVKLADRLHNMRTVWALHPEKAQYLADETMRVWCPMCEYLGLSAVKAELEDICFAVLEPLRFQKVQEDRSRLLNGELSSKAKDRRRRTRRPAPTWPSDNPSSPSAAPSYAHQQPTAPTNPLSFIPPTHITQHSTQPAVSPREREPAAADRATLATHNSASQSHSMHGVSAPGTPSSRPSVPTSVGATSVGVSSAVVASREGSGKIVIADPVVIDVMTAHVGASFDVATGGPVAMAAASDLEAAMRLTSKTAPLLGQSLEQRFKSSDKSSSSTASDAKQPVDTAKDIASSACSSGQLADTCGHSTGSREVAEQNGAAQALEQQITSKEQQQRVSMDDALTACDRAALDGDSQGEEEEEDEYMHTGSMLHSHSLTRSGSHAALLAAGGTLSESESSAVQLAQCVHEVSVDDNFRFAPGRLVDALQPLSPTQALDTPAPYSPIQQQLQKLLECVIPFRLNNFMTRHQDHRPSGTLPPAMRFADSAASAMMGELLVEGVGTGLTIQVQGRVKSLYSTHRKMQLKKIPIEQVYDIIALRVIISDNGGADTLAAIRAAYGVPPIAHRIWRSVTSEFDDYILLPKKSGYQSIHLAAIAPEGVPLEVQVRTSSMHYQAEYGAASHWAYKNRMRASLANKAPSTPPSTPPSPDASIDTPSSSIDSATSESSSISERSTPAPDTTPSTSAEQLEASERKEKVSRGVSADKVEDSGTFDTAMQPEQRLGVEAGQPVLCVDEGFLCDGVVLSSDAEGNLITVATSIRRRWTSEPSGNNLPEGSGIQHSRMLEQGDYKELWAHATKRCLELPGHQDMRLEVREFRRFRGGKYAHVDRFGAIHQFCTLALVEPTVTGTNPNSDVDASQHSMQQPARSHNGHIIQQQVPDTSAEPLAAASAGVAGLAVTGDALSLHGGENNVKDVPESSVKSSRDGEKEKKRGRKVAVKMAFIGQSSDGKLGRWQRFKWGETTATGAAVRRGGVDEDRVLQLRAQLEWGDSARGASEGGSATGGDGGSAGGRERRLPESRRQLFELSSASDLLTRTGLRGTSEGDSNTNATKGSTQGPSNMHADDSTLPRGPSVPCRPGGYSRGGIAVHAQGGDAGGSVVPVGSADGVDTRTRAQSSEATGGSIPVYIYNIGVTEVPQGVTAGDIIEQYGRIEITGEEELRSSAKSEELQRGDAVATGTQRGKKLVNVNNQLVGEDTMLVAGDLVVLSDQVLSNV